MYDPIHLNNLKERFDIYSTPVIYILDKDKKIKAKRIGSDQVVQMLKTLESIDEAHLKDVSASKGRTVGEQFAHMHRVRMMWLKVAEPVARSTDEQPRWPAGQRDRHPADSVGWKSLMRAASDIAAMGGTPRCFRR